MLQLYIAYIVSFWNQNHSLLLALIHFHSFSFVVPLVVIRCHSLYHSLSLVVPLVVIRCHSMYHSSSLVVNRCTTLLSFYKRSSCLFKNFKHSHVIVVKKKYRIFVYWLRENKIKGYNKPLQLFIEKRQFFNQKKQWINNIIYH